MKFVRCFSICSLLLLTLFIITSCGGSGGTVVTPSINNTNPIAQAGNTGTANITIEKLIPSAANTIRVTVTKVSNGQIVYPGSITKPSSGPWVSTINNLPTDEKLAFEFAALDTANNVLSHRIEFRIINPDSTITLTPALGITILPNGVFLPSSLPALPKDVVVFGNSDPNTTSNLSFNLTNYPITLAPIAQFNPNAAPYETSQTLLSYNFPRRIVLGDAPDGTFNVYVTNTVKNLSGSTVNTTYMTLIIQKGNSTLTITRQEE